jgi:hypothetical protein
MAEWLAAFLTEDRPTLVGIDYGFSFPLQYFRQHDPRMIAAFSRLPTSAGRTDEDNTYVDFGVRVYAAIGRPVPVIRDGAG